MDPPRPLFKRCVQDFARLVVRLYMIVFHRIRVHGIENVPQQNGMIICANHQSNLDPIVVGSVMPRRTNYLAKETVFNFKPLGWLLEQFDTIAIDRDGMGVSGMKETLRRLKRNESILIFPEGTRSKDGEMNAFKPGFVALAKRVKSPLLPIGLDGTFASWPPGKLFPIPGRIHAVIGKPVQPEEFSGLSDDDIVELLAGRIKSCSEKARHLRAGS